MNYKKSQKIVHDNLVAFSNSQSMFQTMFQSKHIEAYTGYSINVILSSSAVKTICDILVFSLVVCNETVKVLIQFPLKNHTTKNP